MAQTLDRIPGPAAERQQLRLEKIGVIAGFLLGVVLAAGPVSNALAEIGAADWLAVTAIGLTVAVTTRLGLSAASTVSRKLAG